MICNDVRTVRWRGRGTVEQCWQRMRCKGPANVRRTVRSADLELIEIVDNVVFDKLIAQMFVAVWPSMVTEVRMSQRNVTSCVSAGASLERRSRQVFATADLRSQLSSERSSEASARNEAASPPRLCFAQAKR